MTRAIFLPWDVGSFGGFSGGIRGIPPNKLDKYTYLALQGVYIFPMLAMILNPLTNLGKIFTLSRRAH